jgi:hypothetical protein
MQGQRPRQGAFLLPDKSVVEIVAGSLAQRPMEVFGVRRRVGEARVLIRHAPREKVLPSASVVAPVPQLLPRRSFKALLASSTRSLGGLELTQMISMLSVCNARRTGSS